MNASKHLDHIALASAVEALRVGATVQKEGLQPLQLQLHRPVPLPQLAPDFEVSVGCILKISTSKN